MSPADPQPAAVDGGTLFLVTAPSGAGKTSLVQALTSSDPRVAISVSHTTRAPRDGEVNGTHYHFVDEDAFLALVEAGEFLEHAEVFGRRYGTTRAAVSVHTDAGRDVVLEIDWQGAAQIKARYPGAVGVFVLPPSPQTLGERLRGRGLDSEETIRRRLSEAVLEMRQHPSFDYLVVNEVFDVALEDLRAIVRAQRLRQARQARRHAGLVEALTGARTSLLR